MTKTNLKKQVRQLVSGETDEKMIFYYVNPLTGKREQMNKKPPDKDSEKK